MPSPLLVLQLAERTIFPDYNRKAKTFWWTVVPLGVLAFAYSLIQLSMRPAADVWLTALGTLLVGLCAMFTIDQRKDGVVFTFSDFYVFLILISLGPASATVASVAESVIGSWHTTRRWSSRIGSPAIAAMWMYVAGSALASGLQATETWGLGAAVVITMVFAAGFFLGNTALMLGIPLLKRNERLTLSLFIGQCGAGAVATVVSAGFAALLGYVFHDRLAAVMLGSAPLLAGIIAVLHVFARQQAAYSAAREAVAAAERREAGVAEERRLAEARLQTLQAQIEPHFLYNTLANVQHMIATRPDDAQAMLTGLIRYLRASLPRMRSPSSNLKQEFALAQAYLDIARIRLGGRLTVEVALPPPLEALSFPPLVVQTLVENALKHGVEPKVGPVTVRLDAVDHGNEVCVRVVDTGAGFGAVQGAGVGLKNIRERVGAIYGPRARLTLAPNAPAGVVAEICIPREAA